MNREELSKIKVEGLESGLPKEVIDEIMKLNGHSIEEFKKNNETLTTEINGLKNQLKDANEKIKSFADIDVSELQKSIDDWKTKYETDTKALKDNLSKKEYEFKVKEVMADIKFSSNSAKRTFFEDLKAKELKLENDKILGFDDYLKEYKESDPDAFLKEETGEQDFKSSGGDHKDDPTNDDDLVDKVMGLK